jgi:hypothetical protein
MIPVETFANDTDLNEVTAQFNARNHTKIDLEDFQARAEELKNYNLAYLELLEEEYRKQIQNAIDGKECVGGFEFLHDFENSLMANYRFWDVYHNDYVSKLDPWGGKTRNELLNRMKAILDSTPTNKMAMASADLASGKLNMDTMLNFTRSNSAENVTKENALTMVSYANALEQKNKARSFWKMLGNLRTHFQEKNAIKEMRAAAEKSGESLYNLERLAHKNPDFVEMEKTDLVITRAPKEAHEKVTVDLSEKQVKELKNAFDKGFVKEEKKTFQKNAPQSKK